MTKPASPSHETSFLLLETFARDQARLYGAAGGIASYVRIEDAYSAAFDSAPTSVEEAARAVSSALADDFPSNGPPPTDAERMRHEDLLLTLSALAELSADERMVLCLHAAGYDQRVSLALFGMRAREEEALHARAAERLVERAADTELGARRECASARRDLVLAHGRGSASRRTERHILTCPACPGFLEVFDYQAHLLQEAVPACLRAPEVGGKSRVARTPLLSRSRTMKVALIALVGASIGLFLTLRGGSESAPRPPLRLAPASPYVAPADGDLTKAAPLPAATRKQPPRARPLPTVRRPNVVPAPPRATPPPRKASPPPPRFPRRPAAPRFDPTGPELEFGP